MPRDFPTIQKRPLGRTALEVTQLGYGSMGLRGPRTWGVRVVPDEVADRFLNRVLDCGINFIDTAPDYGISEERIGRYIGSRRNEYFVATKCGCIPKQRTDHLEIAHQWTPEVVKRNLETSLKRLRTDVVDLLQFHGGDAKTLLASGCIDVLTELKSQGTIRYLGISSKLPELPELVRLQVFDTFQVPYSCLAPQHDEWLYEAKGTGAGIILRGGIAQGGPQAEIQRPALNEVWQQARLDQILPESMTAAELILRFTLSHPCCDTTIVGTCSESHLAENVAAAAKGPLDAELVNEIRSRVRGLA